MLKASFIIAAVLIITSCASSNPKTTLAKTDYDNAVTENGEKLFCKSERITGSHMKTKTCMTAAEKAKAKKESEMFVDKMKMKTQQACVRGCG